MKFKGKAMKALAMLLALVLALPMGISFAEEGGEPAANPQVSEPAPAPAADPAPAPAVDPAPAPAADPAPAPEPEPAPSEESEPAAPQQPSEAPAEPSIGEVPAEQDRDESYTSNTVGDAEGTPVLSVADEEGSAPQEDVEIVLVEDSIVLDKSESRDFTDYVKSPEREMLTVVSKDPTIVEVNDEDYSILGQKGGKTELVVSLKDNPEVYKKIPVTVLQAVEELVPGNDSVTLEVDNSITLQVSVLPENATDKSLKWTSDDEGIATVDQNGKITAVSEGQTTIHVLATDNNSVECEIDVEVTKLALVDDEITIGVKEKYFLERVGGSVEGLTFKSSNTKVATVSTMGVVTGVAVGTTTITVKNAKGGEASVTVRVAKAPTKITMSATAMTLGVGDEMDLSVKSIAPANCATWLKYYYPDDCQSSLEYLSLDENIATFSEDGVVTAVGVGTTTVGVRAYNGIAGACKVTVKEAPDRIDSLNMSEVTIAAGQTVTLKATLPAGTAATINWEVSEGGDYIEIDSNGKVTTKPLADELQEGETATAVVRAWTHNYEPGKSALERTCTVTVVPAPETLTLKNLPEVGYFTLGLGEIIQLEPELDKGQTTYTYASSNSKIVATNAAGKIGGKKTGTAWVTIKTHNDLSLKVGVKVVKAPSKVAVSPTSATLGVGATLKLTTAITKGTASKLTFTSSDKTVATVDEYGNIETLKTGTATITVSTFNNKKAYCKLNVVKAPDWIELTRNKVTLSQGQSTTLSLSLPSGTATTPTWKLDENASKYLTVTAAGRLTAIKGVSLDGADKVEVEVKVYAHNWKEGEDLLTDTCTVTVLPEPTKVNLNLDGAVILGVGETLKLNPSVEPENPECTYTYATSNKKLATVTASGIVTAKKTGTVTIGVKAYNGKSATFKIKIVKAPTKVAVAPTSVSLGKGDKLTLKTAVATDPYAKLTFKSSNEKIAEVDENGTITAVDVGTVTITASTYNNKRAYCTVTVKKAPVSISLDQSALKLSVKQTAKLTATPSSDSAATFTWDVIDGESFVKVDNGKVTALAEGEATIRVSSYNWEDNPETLRKTCKVTVLPEPKEIKLDVYVAKLGVGQKLKLTPTVEDTSTSTFTFKSSNTKIATVNAAGEIVGKKAGKATISAISHNGLIAKCAVTVVKAPSTIKISAASKTLGVGEKFTLKVAVNSGAWTSVTYTSSDEEVATVVPTGTIGETCEVEAKGTGTTIITARTHNGKTAKCVVTVNKAPTAISLNKSDAVLAVKQTLALTATLSEGSTGTVTWKSDNESVATVSAAGKVTAVNTGSATIMATTYNYAAGKEELKAVCKVRVYAAPTNVYLNGKTLGSATLGVGETLELEPSVNDGAVTTYTFVSANSSIASISSSGIVTAKKAGTVKVGVKTHNGLAAVYTIQVKSAPAWVKLSETEKILKLGDDGFQLKATLSSGSASKLTFKSSDEDVADVGDDGYVTLGGKTGTATITVKTYNGQTAQCIVSVTKN